MKTHPDDRRNMFTDLGLTELLLLGTIGLISLGGLVGTVLSFWSMGRQAYRKE